MRDGFDLIFVRICKVKLSRVCVRIYKVNLSWVFEGIDFIYKLVFESIDLIYNFKILANYQIKNIVGLDFFFPAISHKILAIIHSTIKYGYLVAHKKNQ